MRIYELAKELDISSIELLDYLKEIGYSHKTASSQIDEKAISDAKRHFLRLTNKMTSQSVEYALGSVPQMFVEENNDSEEYGNDLETNDSEDLSYEDESYGYVEIEDYAADIYDRVYDKIVIPCGMINCFSVDKKMFILPEGSSVIDFAYNIHNALGNSIGSVKVNGSEADIYTSLKKGDVVEVGISVSPRRPQIEWLDHVKTDKARNAIKEYLNIENDEETIEMESRTKKMYALNDLDYTYVPPTVYEGDKPYIFISYSHKDDRKVWEIVEVLDKLGYRVWYDKGIDPGTEWDLIIANHIVKCSLLIAMISNNYIESNNCKNEIKFASSKNKSRLLIYIEDVSLPIDMELDSIRLQAIYEWKYLDKDDFISEVCRARNIDDCKG